VFHQEAADPEMVASQQRNQAEKFRRRQEALADFGFFAFRSHHLDDVLQRATELVAEALDCDLVKVLELQEDGKTMLLKAGVGWPPGIVGHATLGAEQDSPAGFALRSCEPIISIDTSKETRFEIPKLLRDHGVKSMVNVLIAAEGVPYGVLEVDARKQTEFAQDDINFLQTYANILAAAIDRSIAHRALIEAADARKLMLRELQHRTKNLIMNIEAIARRTRSASSAIDDFMRSFTARLQALGRAQDALTEEGGQSASLRSIVTRELAAFGLSESEKVKLSGPEVSFAGSAAWALGLLFHELLTNAQKYGALRAAKGVIELSWETRLVNETLVICWRETGAQLQAPPGKNGFGSQMIRQLIPDMLGGSATLEFQKEGIEYILTCPAPRPAGPG
jgi:two-component sensor histidine kinase